MFMISNSISFLFLKNRRNNMKKIGEKTVCIMLAVFVIVVFFFLTFSFASADITTGLVGHWKLDEGGGTITGDSSGNNNTGILTNGPTWTTGNVGGALSFDAINDFILIPDSPVFDIGAGDMTLTAWIRDDDIASTEGIAAHTDGSAGNDGWWAFINNAAHLEFSMNDSDHESTGTISQGVWNHVTFVKSGTAILFYINGAYDSTVDNGGNINNSDGTFKIGQNGNFYASVFFDGAIDDVRIYNRVLTQAEITELYNYTDSTPPPPTQVGLYDLFEAQVINSNNYNNPFTDVELNAVFTSPTGRIINFFGFYDGDGNGGQNGNIWKQRFMPDEEGTWTYTLTFSDGSPGKNGSFECVAVGAKPGPWQQDTNNPRWFKTSDGAHFLPIAMHANAAITPTDWQDAINWASSKGYNTIITSTMNTQAYGDGWGNVLPFEGTDKYNVDYDRFNIKMWIEWDSMIKTAGNSGIYIGPFNGPSGRYGGQQQGWPPSEMAYFPEIQDRFDTPRNLKIIRYLVARQGAFWNLAFWNLYNTELIEIMSESEGIQYGEYFASITPFGRMITAQDTEQWHNGDNRWLSKMNFSSSRKLNTVQTAVGDPNNTAWQNADLNNQLALDTYRGFPVFTTEGLWEGQGRAQKPLRIVWGFFAAGAHTMWADWSYDLGSAVHLYGSIGRGSIPVYPLTQNIFQEDQLGVDTVGDEQLKIASDATMQLQYWKMSPHNELVSGSTEAYCLAEPGVQYMVYAPIGGVVKLDLSTANGLFETKWLDPRVGGYSNQTQVNGGSIVTLNAPSSQDWVLFVIKPSDTTPPSTPQQLNASPQSENQINLTWQAANDPESGISNYKIYRDGVNIGQPTTTSFLDTGLNEGATYTYEVSSVNGAGLESTKSTSVSATTIADITSPTITSVNTSGNPNQVIVVFSESVEQASATDISNYSIDNAIVVSGISLGSDQKTVTITTSSHTDGVTYSLIVNNVKDRASTPNMIATNTTKSYTFVLQLVISNLTVSSGQAYEIVQNGLLDGVLVFIDRTYVYSGVPVLVEGATYIKTANDDKLSSGSSFITFDVNQDVSIYVAHDDRITTKPSWMVSFNDNGVDLVIASQGHSIWKKDFTTGTITLGGNEGGSSSSMYTVIVVGQGTNSTPDTTPPAIPMGLRIQ